MSLPLFRIKPFSILTAPSKVPALFSSVQFLLPASRSYTFNPHTTPFRHIYIMRHSMTLLLNYIASSFNGLYSSVYFRAK